MKIENYYIKQSVIIAVTCFLCGLILIFLLDKVEKNEKLIDISGRLEYSPVIDEIDNNYYIDIKLTDNPNTFRIDNNQLVNSHLIGNHITELPRDTWINIKIKQYDKDAKYHRLKIRPEIRYLRTQDKIIISDEIIRKADEQGMLLLVLAFFFLLIALTVFNNRGRFNSSTEERFIFPKGQLTHNINEEITWTGSPKVLPFIFSEYFLLLLLFYGIGFYFLLQNSHRVWGFYPDLIVPYLFMASLPLGIIILAILGFRTRYLLTQRHIYIVTSIFFDNVKRIDKEKVISKEEKANPIEQLFDVTTIRFYTGKKGDENEKIYDKFRCINEYEIIDYGI